MQQHRETMQPLENTPPQFDPPPHDPFAAVWDASFGLPPFDSIAPEHFLPAFRRTLAAHRAAIETIAEAAEPASFDNTVGALEHSWRDLSRLSAVFSLLTGAHTNDALEAIDLEVSPLLARHYSEVFQHERLFRRIDALHAQREALDLDDEQRRVLERYHTLFIRAGAALAPDARARLAAINERL